MKLLIVTQTMNPTHPVLGFFVEWVNAFKSHPSVSELQVIETSVPGSRIGRIFHFWNQVRKNKSDAVLVHMTPLWLILGWPLWRLRGTKTALWYTHGTDSRTLRIAVRLADATFTATKNAFPFKHPRVYAVGHGIAPTFAAAERPSRPPDRFAFLAVGRIAPRKRVRETLALFAQIHRLEPRATLTWAGPFRNDTDPYAIKVLEDVKRLSLKDVVHIGKSLPAHEISMAYASHDLLLHLSDTGSLDKVVPEALASGCPVFSTNPATAEALGDAWHWNGRLDTSATEHALRILQEGVSVQTRQQVASQFALNRLIDRLVQHLAA